MTNPVYEIAYGNLSGYFDAVIFTVRQRVGGGRGRARRASGAGERTGWCVYAHAITCLFFEAIEATLLLTRNPGTLH